MVDKLAVLLLLMCCAGFSVAVYAGEPARGGRQLPATFEKLLPLHTRLGQPQPGDWLSVHEEPGQTYGQYVRSRPIKPDRQRRVIDVQPLGDFDATEARIIKLTARLMEIYFGLPVRIRDNLSLDVIPTAARRTHPTWGDKQVLSTYVLSEVLAPRLPKDAAAYIALTTSDLWPGEGWNFVFGQASLKHRVGVWSIYRNGDPHESDESFRLCLTRTIKTATHETGHMFSLPHCTFYECNMCGSNHRAESDRRPLWLCPICLAKLCTATGVEPDERFRNLIEFAEANGLDKEERFYTRSLAALGGEKIGRRE